MILVYFITVYKLTTKTYILLKKNITKLDFTINIYIHLQKILTKTRYYFS